ncbi:MAG TPA: hypothetical protein PLR06_02000 [Cyclobacteriaceae bacterium]|nr:hypothetical protein [Cyclobacteriaceae bacterium]
MRNYFAIAFTIVYLTLTVGVAKTTHYCMGREKHSSLFAFSTQKCACALFLQVKNDCCEDQHDIIKIEDDQAGSKVVNVAAPQFYLSGEVFTLNEEIVSSYASRFQSEIDIHLPPPKIPLYQSFCSLVFYDSIV